MVAQNTSALGRLGLIHMMRSSASVSMRGLASSQVTVQWVHSSCCCFPDMRGLVDCVSSLYFNWRIFAIIKRRNQNRAVSSCIDFDAWHLHQTRFVERLFGSCRDKALRLDDRRLADASPLYSYLQANESMFPWRTSSQFCDVPLLNWLCLRADQYPSFALRGDQLSQIQTGSLPFEREVQEQWAIVEVECEAQKKKKFQEIIFGK